jgi:hypothetical protein
MACSDFGYLVEVKDIFTYLTLLIRLLHEGFTSIMLFGLTSVFSSMDLFTDSYLI